MSPLQLILAQTPSPTPTADVVADVAEAIGNAANPCPNGRPVCVYVLEQTGNGPLASFLGQVVPIAVSILLIFLAAAFVASLVRRLIRRVITKTARDSREVLRAITRRAPAIQTTRTVEEQQAIDARHVQRTATISGVIGSIAVFVVYLVAFLIALSQLNIDVGPLVAGAGVVGVALGFGAQSLVRDFLSGIFMILEDQYGVGDIVDVGDATGTVEAITLRVTRLRDIEGTVWHVPNGQILRVGNLSQLWSRSLLDIGVAYDTDLDHAGEVIKRVADEMAAHEDWADDILEAPDLWGVQQFGPDEVVLRLVIKTKPAAQWKVNREFRARIKKAFDAEGIEIPFPQRTIWLRQEDVPAGIPAEALDADPDQDR